jgi:hypothetical protein
VEPTYSLPATVGLLPTYFFVDSLRDGECLYWLPVDNPPLKKLCRHGVLPLPDLANAGPSLGNSVQHPLTFFVLSTAL